MYRKLVAKKKSDEDSFSEQQGGDSDHDFNNKRNHLTDFIFGRDNRVRSSKNTTEILELSKASAGDRNTEIHSRSDSSQRRLTRGVNPISKHRRANSDQV